MKVSISIGRILFGLANRLPNAICFCLVPNGEYHLAHFHDEVSPPLYLSGLFPSKNIVVLTIGKSCGCLVLNRDKEIKIKVVPSNICYFSLQTLFKEDESVVLWSAKLIVVDSWSWLIPQTLDRDTLCMNWPEFIHG